MLIPISSDETIRISPYRVLRIVIYSVDFEDADEVAYQVLVDTDDGRHESSLFKNREGAERLFRDISERIGEAIKKDDD